MRQRSYKKAVPALADHLDCAPTYEAVGQAMQHNILVALAQATDEDERPFYHHAHAWCRATAERTGHELRTVTRIVALLSPRTPWHENLLRAAQVIEDPEGQAQHIMPDQARKLVGILNGEDTLGGRKVRNFEHNIFDPDHPGYCTNDRHWIRVATGTPFAKDDGQDLLDVPGVYQLVAGATRSVARQLTTTAARVQETGWQWYRRVYAAQYLIDNEPF